MDTSLHVALSVPESVISAELKFFSCVIFIYFTDWIEWFIFGNLSSVCCMTLMTMIYNVNWFEVVNSSLFLGSTTALLYTNNIYSSMTKINKISVINVENNKYAYHFRTYTLKKKVLIWNRGCAALKLVSSVWEVFSRLILTQETVIQNQNQ